MESVSIGPAVVKFRPCHAKSQNRRLLGPTLVEFNKRLKHAVLGFWIILCSHNKIPRLRVVRRCRPSRGFEQTPKFFWFHRPAVERSGTPAVRNQVMNGRAGFRWP